MRETVAPLSDGVEWRRAELENSQLLRNYQDHFNHHDEHSSLSHLPHRRFFFVIILSSPAKKEGRGCARSWHHMLDAMVEQISENNRKASQGGGHGKHCQTQQSQERSRETLPDSAVTAAAKMWLLFPSSSSSLHNPSGPPPSQTQSLHFFSDHFCLPYPHLPPQPRLQDTFPENVWSPLYIESVRERTLTP